MCQRLKTAAIRAEGVKRCGRLEPEFAAELLGDISQPRCGRHVRIRLARFQDELPQADAQGLEREPGPIVAEHDDRPAEQFLERLDGRGAKNAGRHDQLYSDAEIIGQGQRRLGLDAVVDENGEGC